MNYQYEKKFTFNQSTYINQLYRKYTKAGMSFNAFQRDLMHRNISYKRVDMLADWNRALRVEHGRNAAKRERAALWYDNVEMPLMKKYNKTPSVFFKEKFQMDPDEDMTTEEMIEWEIEMADMREEEREIYGRTFV